MNIVQERNEAALSVALEGRLDTLTSPEFEAAIKGSLDGVTELVLDFGKLEYVSSAGLRVLLAAQKAMAKQGKMRIVNVSSGVMEVFEMTGFSSVLCLE